MPYVYSKGDMPAVKMQYSYSPFTGVEFLHDWIRDRDETLAYLETSGNPDSHHAGENDEGRNSPKETLPAERLFQMIRGKIVSTSSVEREDARRILAALVKRFEVTGKIHDSYDTQFRPLDKTAYSRLGDYVLFAQTLQTAYETTGSLVFLNALLKCVDILCSARARIPDTAARRVAATIEKEREYVVALCAARGVEL